MCKPSYCQFSEDINVKLLKLSISDNYHTLIALGVDYFFIILAAYLTICSIYFYPLTLLVIGARQRGLATILHEAAHNRAASNSIFNAFIGSIMSGYCIFQMFKSYKHSHVFLHHGHFGDPNNDPDFQFHITQGLYKNICRRKFLIDQVILPLFMMKSIPYFLYLIKNRLNLGRKPNVEVVWFTIFWLCIISFISSEHMWNYFLFFWIVPYFTTFIVMGHFIELSEHYPLIYISGTALKMSRNRFSHWFEAFFFSIHNENYHLTHHLRPGIPFWALKQAHEVMMEDANYRQVNEHFGGIFLSKESNKSCLITLLLREKLNVCGKSV